MNKIVKKFKTVQLSEQKYFLIFYLTALLIHQFLPLNWGDDSIFNVEAVVGITEFLKGSSRLLTDSMTYIFCRWHILWRLANPVILTVLIKTLSELVPSKNKDMTAKLFCITMIYPTMIIVDAGFIATTVNYLWPITFALINILVFQNLYGGQRFNPMYPGVIPLLLYALNMEMLSAVLTCVFLLGCALMIYNKRVRFLPFVQGLISIGGLLVAYIGNINGDNSRMAREIGRYFPDYESLDILNKIELGFSSTFYCMTMKLSFASIAFIAFAIFLALTVFKVSKNICLRISALFPCVFAVIFSVISVTPFNNSDFISFFTGGMQNYKMNKAVYSFEIVPDMFFVLIAVCVLISVGFLFKSKTDILKAYFILGAGLGTRLIMGFSPTVWASGYRTFAIFIITMIIVAVMIADRYYNKNNSTES